MTLIRSFLKDESGATAIEYGLIAALVGIAINAGLSALATDLNEIFGHVGNELDGARPAAPAP